MARGNHEPAGYPEGEALQSFVSRRQRVGQIWKTLFLAATVVGIIALLALLYNVINQSFGYVAYQNQVDPQALILDYYKKQMLDAPRKVTSEDDTELVAGISNRPTAIGFFGYAYYAENAASLKLMSVDGVAPSADTVASAQYELVRPLYIYSSASVLREKPQVAGFIQYYLANANAEVAQVGYFPAPQEALAASQQAWARASGGSAQALPASTAAGGDITVAGSSTVAPLTQRVAEGFAAQGFAGQVKVDITGTGLGFKAFCEGRADLANASRTWTREELLGCRAAGRELVEFRVGTDGLAVVTSAKNSFLQNVTREQLRAIFTTADKWSDVDPSWPAKPILRYIPGTASGTLDFFVANVWPKTLAEAPQADQIAMLTANISAGRLRALAAQKPLTERTNEELVQLLTDEVVKPKIAATWTLIESIFNKAEIETQALLIPNSRLNFRSWVTGAFLASPQSSKPELAGVRTAIFGSLWVTLIAFLFSVPLGVGRRHLPRRIRRQQPVGPGHRDQHQ